LAIDTDGVAIGVGLGTLLSDYGAVEGDATGSNDFFGFAARGDAGGGEDFLEAFGHWEGFQF
jgi:hypothetical protein